MAWAPLFAHAWDIPFHVLPSIRFTYPSNIQFPHLGGWLPPSLGAHSPSLELLEKVGQPSLELLEKVRQPSLELLEKVRQPSLE